MVAPITCRCPAPDPLVGDYCRNCNLLVPTEATRVNISGEEARRRAHARDLRKVKRELLALVEVVDQLINQAAS